MTLMMEHDGAPCYASRHLEPGTSLCPITSQHSAASLTVHHSINNTCITTHCCFDYTPCQQSAMQQPGAATTATCVSQILADPMGAQQMPNILRSCCNHWLREQAREGEPKSTGAHIPAKLQHSCTACEASPECLPDSEHRPANAAHKWSPSTDSSLQCKKCWYHRA